MFELLTYVCRVFIFYFSTWTEFHASESVYWSGEVIDFTVLLFLLITSVYFCTNSCCKLKLLKRILKKHCSFLTVSQKDRVTVLIVLQWCYSSINVPTFTMKWTTYCMILQSKA